MSFTYIYNCPLGIDKDFSFLSVVHSIHTHRRYIMSQYARRKTTDTREHVEYDIKNVPISNSMIIKNKQFSTFINSMF